MQIKTLELTELDLQRHANSIKEDVINRLAADGILENPDTINSQYIYVTASKGLFGKIFDKLFGLDSSEKTSLRLLHLAEWV